MYFMFSKGMNASMSEGMTELSMSSMIPVTVNVPLSQGITVSVFPNACSVPNRRIADERVSTMLLLSVSRFLRSPSSRGKRKNSKKFFFTEAPSSCTGLSPVCT